MSRTSELFALKSAIQRIKHKQSVFGREIQRLGEEISALDDMLDDLNDKVDEYDKAADSDREELLEMIANRDKEIRKLGEAIETDEAAANEGKGR